MAESVVVVQRNGGGYVEGAKVALGFWNGFTETVFTDKNGEAVIEHINQGKATIYVNGRVEGTMEVPSRKLVFI
jgi:hypothetical protein